MDEITLINPNGYDLKGTILINNRLHYAKHHVCQTCGVSECVQYWTEGNGVARCESPVLGDAMIYGKLFGRCLECRIPDPDKEYFYQPRLDIFGIEDGGRPFKLSLNLYDPNRDQIISDSTLIEWSKIR